MLIPENWPGRSVCSWLLASVGVVPCLGLQFLDEAGVVITVLDHQNQIYPASTFDTINCLITVNEYNGFLQIAFPDAARG